MFCFEIEFHDGSFCYIDGRTTCIMAADEITKTYYDILMIVKSGLVSSRVKIDDSAFIKLFFNNTSKQQKLMVDFVGTFSRSVNKPIKSAAVFYRNDLISVALDCLSRARTVFMCSLNVNQFKGLDDFKILEDFKLLRRYVHPLRNNTSSGDGEFERCVEWVSDARYALHDLARKAATPVRVGLVVKFLERKTMIIPIITNVSADSEQDISKVANKYFENFNNEQNLFLDLALSIESEVKANSMLSFAATNVDNIDESGSRKSMVRRFKAEEEMVYPPYMSVRSISDDMGKVRNSDEK